MIIKKYSCKRFAGLKDRSVHFQDGINVLLGENESGKSTLVEGIHSVMFKSAKYDKRAASKAFYDKFMPLPQGDIIDGEMVISSEQGDYVISKEWGPNPSIKLTAPSGVITSEDKINKVLKDVLMFGEGTFSNILFSKQVNIREALKNITGSPETTSEISTLLRKAVMELDGVSVDRLGTKIDAEIENLLKRWDIERNYPENNRGISNPYKTGIGEVVTLFYKKEGLRRNMQEAKEKQIHFDEICSRLVALDEEIIAIKQQKEKMEEIENDVIKRSLLEPKIAQYDKDQQTLMKINLEWPQHEMRLTQLKEELKTLAEDEKKLAEEKLQAGKVKEKEALKLKLDKVDELKRRIEEQGQEIKDIKNITKEHLSALEKYRQGMQTAEAKMQAGVMIGKLDFYTGNNLLTITRDLEEPAVIKPGDTFKANGFIKLEGDILSLEIKSGDIDFTELRKQYEDHKKKLESLLAELHVTSIEEAKLNKEKADRINQALLSLKEQMDSLLESETYETLQEKLSAYGDLSSVRSLAAIESVGKQLNDKKTELLSSRKTLEMIVNNWRQEYTDINGLFQEIVAIKLAQEKDTQALRILEPLPEEYENADKFRSELIGLRKSYEETQISLVKLKEDYYDSEKNLPEYSYEELAEEFQAAEKKFAQTLEKAKKLLKIKAAFESARAKIDENSFKPVADAFSKYVVMLTRESFIAGGIDNRFELQLKKKDPETEIPMDLLSTGTYDSVALALRLAILEYILGNTKGFMILDDCLVDLDPGRKQIAADLIKSFAQKHQVIFTTCSPETAQLLGGNIIMM